MSDRLVILLHGVGSNGADLAGLGNVWAGALPNTGFAAPDGPDRFNAGFQWFSIVGVTEDNRPARVEAARPAFDAILTRIIAEHGFADRLGRVALVGFSQGSIMALDALASGRWAVGAIVAFSGRLASPAPLSPAVGTLLLLVHGDADRVMPAAESTRAATTLSALGVRTEALILPGVGHTISGEGAASAVEFLVKTLA